MVFMMTAVQPVNGVDCQAIITRESHNGGMHLPHFDWSLVTGFATDLIGIHSIFGAFMFGLTIPKEGKFAGRLFERIEDFVSELMPPSLLNVKRSENRRGQHSRGRHLGVASTSHSNSMYWEDCGDFCGSSI